MNAIVMIPVLTPLNTARTSPKLVKPRQRAIDLLQLGCRDFVGESKLGVLRGEDSFPNETVPHHRTSKETSLMPLLQQKPSTDKLVPLRWYLPVPSRIIPFSNLICPLQLPFSSGHLAGVLSI